MKETPMTDHYLSYGMLTDPGIMTRGEFLGGARLLGYRPEMLAFANIVPDRAHEFRGVLWGINRSILRELDQVEGFPDFYTRIRVDVLRDKDRQPVNAWVYMMTPDSRLSMINRAPSRNYLRSVRNGYSHAGLPYPFP